MQCIIMHNYAQLCTIMHDAFGRGHKGIANKRDPGTANLLSFGSRRDTTLFLILRRWKNFIVLQSIFSSGNMCRCILLDKIVQDKHNNGLHYIMHHCAQLCTILEISQIVHYAQLCICIIFPPLHNAENDLLGPGPLCTICNTPSTSVCVVRARCLSTSYAVRLALASLSLCSQMLLNRKSQVVNVARGKGHVAEADAWQGRHIPTNEQLQVPAHDPAQAAPHKGTGCPRVAVVQPRPANSALGLQKQVITDHRRPPQKDTVLQGEGGG